MDLGAIRTPIVWSGLLIFSDQASKVEARRGIGRDGPRETHCPVLTVHQVRGRVVVAVCERRKTEVRRMQKVETRGRVKV
jgi:hypothetical protein